MVNSPPTNEEDVGLILGSGRAPGEENGNPLQYSCLQNSMDSGTRWATVHGVTKSQTQRVSLSLSFFATPTVAPVPPSPHDLYLSVSLFRHKMGRDPSLAFFVPLTTKQCLATGCSGHMTEQVVKKEGPRGQGHCPTEDPVIAKGDAVELLKNSENALFFYVC